MRHNSETETCETIQAGMTALLDNELAPGEAAALRSHIAGCAVCAPVFAQVEKTVQLAHSWKAEGADIWEAVERRLTSSLDNALPQSLAPLRSRSHLSEILTTKRKVTAEQLAEAGAQATEDAAKSAEEPAGTINQEDLRAVLTEMRALRTEIQELRGEVGTLRRLLSATRQAAPAKGYRPLSPPQLMPLALPEDSGFGLL
ncbi:MAG: zf-HC2 domain-containing protein [Armatimonadota bacterium]